MILNIPHCEECPLCHKVETQDPDWNAANPVMAPKVDVVNYFCIIGTANSSLRIFEPKGDIPDWCRLKTK